MVWLGKYFLMSGEESDWVEEQLRKLYDSALDRNQLKHYNKHGLDIKYALVDTRTLRRPGPSIDPITKWIYHYKYAFNISRRPGEDCSLIFVCSDLVLPKFYDLAAVHEYGDIIHQHDGDIHEIHKKSIRLEFEIAKKEGLHKEYMEWIKNNWPSRMDEIKRIGINIQTL